MIFLKSFGAVFFLSIAVYLTLTVEQMVDEIEDFTLHQIVAEADEFTLQILLMKAQGYSTRDICLHFGVDKGVVYGRIRRLRNKIVNKL